MLWTKTLIVIGFMGFVGASDAAGAHSRCTELPDGVRLPTKGPGYAIPKTWAERGLSWGSRELVGLSQRAARRVAREAAGSTLFIGDLSQHGGGATQWHRSHRHGRDADLIFYATDDHGRPLAAPSSMRAFNAHGLAEGGKIRFDVKREWLLVRALLEDRKVAVRYLFIYEPLREKLLDYAASRHESRALIDKAAVVMKQPMDSAPHDDHLHLRIVGPLDDHEAGCRVEHARPSGRARATGARRRRHHRR